MNHLDERCAFSAGWSAALVYPGGVLFLSVGDSTGTIQVVVESSGVPCWSELKALKPESSLMVLGSLAPDHDVVFDIVTRGVGIISKATGMLHPDIRHAGLSILASQNTDVLLSHRHFYLRNHLILALNL